jgi:hypothetical protein
MSAKSGKQKIKEVLIQSCLVVFFLTALITMVRAAKHDYDTFQKFTGLNDEQKRELLIGDFYGFIRACSRTIPEEANILLLTDDGGSDGLYLSYHLYPRKLFFDGFDPIRKTPTGIDQLDKDWLNRKKIEWIIYRFTREVNYSKIVQIDDGEIIQEIAY